MNKERLLKILNNTYIALDKFIYFIPGIPTIYLIYD